MNTPKEVLDFLNQCREVSLRAESYCNEYMAKHVRFGFVDIEDHHPVAVVRKTSVWYGCRGYVCECWFDTLHGRTFKHDGSYVAPGHVHGKPSMLLVRDISRHYMHQTVMMLNCLENKAGWDKTVYREVSQKGARIPIFLVVGPRQWFGAMPYISLYTLLIRIGSKTLFEGNDTFKLWWSRVYHDKAQIDNSTIHLISSRFMNLLEILMDHHEFIVEGAEYGKSKELYRGAAQEAGIHHLVEAACDQVHKSLDDPADYSQALENTLRYAENATKMQRGMPLRLAIALQEYGVPKPA